MNMKKMFQTITYNAYCGNYNRIIVAKFIFTYFFQVRKAI